ncbi:MAG: DUF4038 domain-containing protein [Proteobacteria bacterium]|nr:DUF4038 domain-containing protein [Pseudomonadota bacterium]
MAASVLQACGTSAPAPVLAPPLAPNASPQQHAHPAAERAARFPLHVEAGKRYLVDSAGAPFLLQGDAAWSLVAQLQREDVLAYMADRRARGFNALLVELEEHYFADHPPANAYGVAPFTVPGDFSTPNEAYFAHVDWVLTQAARQGFLVLLTPAYLGYDGEEQGWYREMRASGAQKLFEYGRYLGHRYGHYTNILWVEGGDYNAPDMSVVDAVARGIDAGAGVPQLHTYHGQRGTSAREAADPVRYPWLNVNAIYTHTDDVVAHASAAYRQSGMPFFLIENYYEGNSASASQVRQQAWEALLSGACGQVFGNEILWNFNGNPPDHNKAPWQAALDSAGARSMSQVGHFFAGKPWWLLRPRWTAAAPAVGRGTPPAPTTAVASDGSLAVVYYPRLESAPIDLRALRGPRVRARWFDPADGSWRAANAAPYTNTTTVLLAPPGVNSGRGLDWVLSLESIGPVR